MKAQREQTAEEEQLNVITHAFGLIISVFGSVLLLLNSLKEGVHLRFFSNLIYCLGLITLYLASTLYHSSGNKERKKILNIFDHSAIYLLIAGTYTPITLLSIKGIWGLAIVVTVWIIALFGIVLKLYFTGQYPKISTSVYVLMGWLIIIAIKPLINSMKLPGLLWLLAGGLFYTVGALLYQRRSMKYNHVVFHIFVLLGSLCHFIVVYNYTN